MILTSLPGNDLGAYNGISSGFAYSIGITVGTNALQLDSVDLRLKSISASGNATVELRSDIAGTPSAAALKTFTSQTVSANGFNTYSFAPNGTVSLSAGTTYWLTILNDFQNPNGLIISASNPPATPTSLAASYAGLRFGTPTNQALNAMTLPVPSFQLNGSISAVPEPTWLAALGMGMTSLTWSVRSRWRRKLPLKSS
jgi:hypothetical protein